MEIPPSRAYRLRLFKETGRAFHIANELFAENSRPEVMLGQRITLEQYQPIVNVMSEAELARFFAQLKTNADRTLQKLPSDKTYIEQYCKAAD